MAKNGLLRRIGISLSSSMSKTMKFIGKINLSTLIETFLIMPLGYLRDLSASCRVRVVGLASPRSSFLNMDRGIKLMLDPRSHSAFLNVVFPTNMRC